MPPNSARSDAGLVEAGQIYVNRHPACRFCVHVRTIVGIATAIVMFWAAISLLIEHHSFAIGIFLLFVGVPVFLLEFGAVVRTCCGTDGVCCRFFALILGLDGWKRGVFYALIALVCFMPDVTAMPAKVAGGLLAATALLYIAKTFQKKKVKTFVVDGAPTTVASQNPPAPATTYRTTSPTTKRDD